MDGMDKLVDTLNMDFTGLSFLNLVDFDALFGHRRIHKDTERLCKNMMHVFQKYSQNYKKMIYY